MYSFFSNRGPLKVLKDTKLILKNLHRDTLGVLKYFNALNLIPKERIKYKQEIDGALLSFSAVHNMYYIF